MAADFSDTKFLTYDALKRINASSVHYKRNRNVYFDRLPIHDDGTVYPVSMSFVHNDREIRTQITLNKDGETIFLDMSFDEFKNLPTYGEFQEAITTAEANTDSVN